jgi:hypothetical protein
MVRHTVRYCRCVTREEGQSVRLVYDFVPETPDKDGVSAVTVVAPWLAWQDEDTEEDRGWTVALRFERRDGSTDLVDLHVFSTGEPSALGRGIPLPGKVQDKWNAPGGAVFRTSALFEGTNYRPGAPPPGGISTRMLRKYPLGRIEANARRYLAEHDQLHAEVPDWSEQAHTRPGRRGRADLFYAQIAADYVAALDSGASAPVSAAADRRHLARTTVRNMLSEARRRGLLTRPTKRGAADGSLTPKAQDLLSRLARRPSS